MAALNECIAIEQEMRLPHNEIYGQEFDPESVAVMAYAIADAMLKERGVKHG